MQTKYLSLLNNYMLFYNMILNITITIDTISIKQPMYDCQEGINPSNSSFQLYLGCRSGINSSKYDVEEVSIDPPIIDNSKIFILNCMQKSNIMHILMMVFITNELKGYSRSLLIIIFKVHHLLHASLKPKTYMLNQTLVLNMSLAHNKNNGKQQCKMNINLCCKKKLGL